LTINSDGSINTNLYSDGEIISSASPLPISDIQYTTAIENNAMGLAQYIGEALPGLVKGTSGWRIKKLVYDGNFVTDIQWAGSAASFNKIWNDRASYFYS